jgi:rifampicin phosphotransferase
VAKTSDLIMAIATPDASLEIVGGKARSLAILATHEMPVPSGFVITTEGYNKFVEASGLSASIHNALTDLVDYDTKAIEAASGNIQSLFNTSKLELEQTAEILNEYSQLDHPAVAVRSSATAEDLPELSFAGQQETYLNVQGDTALLTAIKHCWSSLWSARAITYRLKHNIDQKNISMAVVVQSMLEPQVSGILFTANPVTGDRSEIMINASYGLGEAIVGGQVSPDSFILDRDELTTKETLIGSKEVEIVQSGDQGVSIRSINPDKQAEPSMTETALSDLARLGLHIEQLFQDVPQDIEWAIADGQIYCLQSRPITHLPVAPLKDVMWEPEYEGGKLIRRQVVENMPDPLSPLFSELYLEVGLEHSMDQLMDHWKAPFDVGDFITRPIFTTVNGYAYCRADYRIPWRQIPAMILWYLRMLPTMLRDLIPQWQDHALPDYLAVIEHWESQGTASASDEQLLSGLRKLTIADADYWFSLTMVVGIAKVTDGALHTFVSRLIKGELISGMFLRGFPSKTMEAMTDLEAIARQIQDQQTLMDLVRRTPAKHLPEVLQQHEDGVNVLSNLFAYLQKYGHQVYNLDFVEQTQAEDPLPVLLSLKGLVSKNLSRDVNQQEEMVAQRDSLEAQTSASLGPVRRWIFRKLLGWAQTYGPFREESLFYMGAAWPVLRRITKELGKRLVEAGTLTSPDDTFYLRTSELEAACLARQEGRAMAELAETVSERFELREARKKLHPPPMVPEGRYKFGIVDMSFMETQKRNKDESMVLKGFAVSPGKITGTASVIMSPTDFEKMQPDTILVCPTTTPAWTPLFSQATALVTDIGGILAHGSIVARECGIPAVMGTGNITTRIVTGQQITVDGEAGTVTIID